VINSSQRPLPGNTQHSQQTDIHAPVGFEPTISAGERAQTYALDRAATGTGHQAVKKKVKEVKFQGTIFFLPSYTQLDDG
jgi:hypothetical protein